MALSQKDQIKAAYFHLVEGIAQDQLARIMGVNQGRISEAVQAVKAATSPSGVRGVPVYGGKVLREEGWNGGEWSDTGVGTIDGPDGF